MENDYPNSPEGYINDAQNKSGKDRFFNRCWAFDTW